MLNTLCASLAAVGGAFVALFPRRVIDPITRVALAGYENPEDLEPSEWYVQAIRTKFALISVAGVVALAVEGLDGAGGRGEADVPETELEAADE